ncbi:hypothetical protein F5Y16DRAFT_367876 [Xylariaceae sp. FL0255]|nr:hypothetical protein F5Y16DRAFT_367876 [Xylariaceae sp. FL0255]
MPQQPTEETTGNPAIIYQMHPLNDGHSASSVVSYHTDGHKLDDVDVEVRAMTPPRSPGNLSKKTSTSGSEYLVRAGGSVWPGQSHWKEQARAADRRNRSCSCMARLGKRARIAVKIAIALLVVGVAVGVGLGISKSLGAPFWQPKAVT